MFIYTKMLPDNILVLENVALWRHCGISYERYNLNVADNQSIDIMHSNIEDNIFPWNVIWFDSMLWFECWSHSFIGEKFD